MCGLSALRASGRFRVIVALCPSTSYLMVSYDGAELADINVPCCLVGMDIDDSSSVELRWASFAECREAFFEIASSAREFEGEQFLRHRLAKRCVLAVIDGLL